MNTTNHTFLDFEADHPEEIKQMHFLDETTLQNRLLGNNPFQDIQSAQSFEEIKNQIAYRSPLAERSRPQNNLLLLTDEHLSVFDNDFGYLVTTNKYTSGKKLIDEYQNFKPEHNQICFFCEIDSEQKSNLFGTLFLVKIGSKMKSLLNRLESGEKITLNSKLNTKIKNTAKEVSSFEAILNEIYQYVSTRFGNDIEKDFLTLDRIKTAIQDELSFTRNARRTMGEILAWQNGTLDYLMEKSDAFFEQIMFKREDYTPHLKKVSENKFNQISEDDSFISQISTYASELLSSVKNFIIDHLPEKWKKLVLKLQDYVHEALSILNGFTNFLGDLFYLIKAYCCGLINGLLSTIQFIIQIFIWLNKNHAKSLFTGELYLSIQSKLESIEDFIDVFYETKDSILQGLKKLVVEFELESLLAVAKAIYGNTESRYTKFDYAYLTGRIIFEIVIGVILTVFTGGGEAIKLASTISQEIIEFLKLAGREALSALSGGIFDLTVFLKNFLFNFAQAAKKGWKAVQKFFEEFFSNKKPNEVMEEFGDQALTPSEKRKNKKYSPENIKGEGVYNGKILSKNDIEEWAKVLKKKYRTTLKKVESFDDPKVLAQFDPNTNTILYKNDVTEYLMAHESFHAEEMHKLGFEEYVKDAPFGIKSPKFPDEYTDANLIRVYKREKYVHDKIIKNDKNFNLNSEELRHNFFNLDFYQYHLEKRNIKIPN